MTGERWEDKVNRLAKELAGLGFSVVPTPPKGLFGPRCQRCECRVIASTGDLIGGRFCGRCAGIDQVSREQAA